MRKVLIQLSEQPKTPIHVDMALKDNIKSYWIGYMFTCYDKMYNSDTLSCSFPRIELSIDTQIFSSRPSFEVKISSI